MSFSRDVTPISNNLVDVKEAIREIKEKQNSSNDDMFIRIQMKRQLMIMMKVFINMGKSYYKTCEFIYDDEEQEEYGQEEYGQEQYGQYEQEEYEQEEYEQDDQDKYQEGDSDNEIVDWY